MNVRYFALGAYLLVFGYSVVAYSSETNTERTPNDWLLNAADDETRFELLQRYLRGFDQPMWEVGERYKSMFHALERENIPLAQYHWKKIRTTIENGYLKRPARRSNAETLFLTQNWQEVLDLFSSNDIGAAWNGFETARIACMECHIAESVSFMNDQPIFELSNTTIVRD